MKLLGSSTIIGLRTHTNAGGEHRFKRARRVATERESAYLAALVALPPRNPLPTTGRFVVGLTRVSPATRPPDDDNARVAMKHVRDGIADRLGVDDGDTSRVRWEYATERGPWGVRFTVALEDLGRSRT